MDSEVSVVLYKLVSIVLIFLCAIVGGVMPFYCRGFSAQRMSLINLFTAGVFLAAAFQFLLPKAVIVMNEEFIKATASTSSSEPPKDPFPYPYMFCVVGFLLVFCVERYALYWKSKLGTKNSNALVVGAEEDKNVANEAACGMEMSGESLNKPLLPTSDPGEESSDAGSNDKLIGLIVFCALGVHSLMEGLGLGAQSYAAWDIFLAIIAHKGIAAFALGSKMLQAERAKILKTKSDSEQSTESDPSRMNSFRQYRADNSVVQKVMDLVDMEELFRYFGFFMYMLLFSAFTPLGILIGWGISAGSSDTSVGGAFSALAAGTFLYVGLYETLQREMTKNYHPDDGKKCLCLLAGYVSFGVLAFWV